jgi:nitrile hydratase
MSEHDDHDDHDDHGHPHHGHPHHGHSHGIDDPDHPHNAPLTDVQLRVRALESLLTEKGLVDPAALDALVDTYQTQVGPRNGAQVVAKAWTDPAFKQRLLDDATRVLAELGFVGRQGEDMMVLENTEAVHNLVVCTLCSCYPWPVLGLPPVWYKSAPYRSRAVIDPRGVLREFGVELPDDTEVRVWDSTAEMRYLVLPRRPGGTDGMSEDELAALVTRDAMIGTALVPRPPGGAAP